MTCHIDLPYSKYRLHPIAIQLSYQPKFDRWQVHFLPAFGCAVGAAAKRPRREELCYDVQPID